MSLCLRGEICCWEFSDSTRPLALRPCRRFPPSRSVTAPSAYSIPLTPLPEQERIVAELDAEAARIEAVRGLIPAFEAKIQRVLARVWGTAL